MKKKEMKMKNSKRKNLVFLLLLISLSALVFSLVSAEDINLKISADLNGFSTDFYAITDANANSSYDGYDMGIQPLQTNDSRLFSWCNPGANPSTTNSTCSLVVDSWNASSRVFYLVYRFNPASSGTLDLAWNSSVFGAYYNASLIDYGTNSTYSSGANVSLPLDMKVNETYSTSFTGWRYLTMNITYYYCGDGRCDSRLNETCSTCSADCGSCGGGGETTGGGAITPVTCIPSCPSASSITCGSALGSDGCGGTCSGTGTECDSGYVCEDGKCIQHECSLLNPCRDEECIDYRCENNQCIAYFTSDSCDDGDECTTGDRCDSGECKAGAEKECDYGCDPDTGKCYPEPILTPDEIPDDILALAGTGTAGAGCTVNIENLRCGDFGACSVEYDVTGLIEEAQVSGIQTRKCIDTSGCLPDYEESRVCSLKEDVTVRDTVWCEEEYTELVDSSGKIVVRMKKTSGGQDLAVELNAAGNGYCAYCYNAAKDGDEEGIDCGGSCEKCGTNFAEYKGPLYDASRLMAALLFFLFFISSFIFLIADFALYIKDIFLLKRLGRKYSYWKKGGYDVDVLEKDLQKMEKSLEYKVHKTKG